MKKLLAALLCVLIICPLFTGCDSTGGRTGTEIAKLMLANSRLNEELLKGGSDITGFAQVKAETLNSVVIPDQQAVTTLAGSSSGGTVTWSDFDNEANTYEFFESYIIAIESMAERGAELIESFKTKYNITDYWVKKGNEAYLFQVNAGEEILYTKDKNGYFICKRYTNENAQDVYDMYLRETASDISVDHYTRMLYIPGVRYEFSYEQPAVDDDVYIVAENQRGYWNMFYTNSTPSGFNFSNLVTTDTIAFSYSDAVQKNSDSSNYFIVFSSPDLKKDILTFSPNDITLHLGAFNNVSKVTLSEEKTTFVEGNGGGYVGTYVEGSLITSSGKTINAEDSFAGGTVVFRGAEGNEHRNEHEPQKTFGSALLSVEGENISQRFANLKTALGEMGISSTFSLDTIAGYIPTAQAIGDQFKKYYNWNGFNFSSYQNINKAIDVENTKRDAFDAMYEQVKDNKTVTFTPKGLAFENYDFADYESFNSGNVNFEGDTVTVKDLSAVISDTTLLDAGKEYTVDLALARITGTGNEALSSDYKNGNITLSDITVLNDTEADYDKAVILEKTGGNATKYVADSKLSVSQSATYKLPTCDGEGTYTVVAYVSTNEGGIRISQMIPLSFAKATETQKTYPGIDGTLSLNGKKELVAKYVRNLDIFISSATGKKSYTYTEAYDELKKAAFNYGMPIDGAVMEVYNTSTNSGSTAQSGKSYSGCVLRLKYTSTANGTEKQSYVYLTIN